MQKNDVAIGKQYQCHSVLLENQFAGDVIALNENTCIVEMVSCTSKDRVKSLEFNNRFVVRFDDMTAS